MAEVNNFYAEQTTASTFSAAAWAEPTNTCKIAGTSLAASTRYLIIAKAVLSGSNNADDYGCRISTADDTNIGTRSEMRIQPTYTTSGEGKGFMFVGSFTTDSTPADVAFQVYSWDGTAGYIDQMSLLLIDLSDVGGFSEISWEPGSYGNNRIYGVGGTLEAQGQSFTPAATDTLSEVWFYMSKTGSPTDNLTVEIRTGPVNGGSTVATSDTVAASGISTTAGWVKFTFSTPPTLTGGTQYFFRITRSGARDTSNYINAQDNLITDSYDGGTRTELNSGTWTNETDDLRFIANSTNNKYVENWGLGSEGIGTTSWGDVLADLPFEALTGTTEYLVLGFSHIDVLDNKSNMHTRLFGDSNGNGTQDQLSYAGEEGEIADELRVFGYMGRVLTEATPADNIEIQAYAEATSDWTKLYAYLIAIDVSVFNGFDYVFAATGATVSGTPAAPTTLATISSFVPAQAGNHLLLGRYNYTTGGAEGRVSGQITYNGTTVLTGDINKFQTQAWDVTDGEAVQIMARESLSATADIDLDGATEASDTDATSEYEFLAVLDLTLAAAGQLQPVAGVGSTVGVLVGALTLAPVIRQVAGIATASAHATATLNTTRFIEASAPNVAAATGDLARIKGLEGIAAAAAHATGTLTKTRPVTATGTAAAHAAGALTVIRRVTATGSNVAEAAGVAEIVKIIRSVGGAAAHTVGVLVKTRAVFGTVANVAAGSGVLSTIIPVESVAGNSAHATGTVGAVRPVTGTTAAAAHATGSLSVARPIAATSGASAHATGTITPTRHLASAAGNSAHAAADLTVTVGGALIDIAGTGITVAHGAATLITIVPVTATAPNVAAGSGSLTITTGLSATSIAVADAAGAVRSDLTITATAGASAHARGDLNTQGLAALTATGPNVAAATGTLSVTRPAVATGANVAVLVGTLGTVRPVAAAGPAVGVLVGDTEIGRGITGSGTAVGVLIGALRVTRPIDGVGVAVSVAVGTVTTEAVALLESAGPNVHVAVGALTVTRPVAAAGPNVGVLVGTVEVDRGLVAVGANVTVGVGVLSIARPLAGVAAAAGHAVGAVTTEGFANLTGVGANVAHTAGTLSVTRPVVAVGGNVAAGSGTLTAVRPLVGVAVGVGVLRGATGKSTPLTGTGATVASTSGTVERTVAIAATGAASAHLIGAITVLGQIDFTATAPNVAVAVGQLAASKQITVTGTAVGHASGTLTVTRPVAGTVAASGHAAGTISAGTAITLTGTLTAVNTVSGQPDFHRYMTGVVAQVSAITVIIETVKRLSGSGDASAHLAALALGSIRYLSGQTETAAHLIGDVSVTLPYFWRKTLVSASSNTPAYTAATPTFVKVHGEDTPPWR